MQVGVGFGDNPDSVVAGQVAAKEALQKGGRAEKCDMVLLFSTATHNQEILRETVAAEVGADVPIYGGGAVGIITNETFGYAGDQVGVACLWLDGAGCEVIADKGLLSGEEATGERLGQELAKRGTTPDSSVMLFYDAVDCSGEGVRIMMATWLLEGLEKGLGFLPNLTGAGLQGDHNCTPSNQYVGDQIGNQYAMALKFSDDIQIDSVIMHGCHPASKYHTVTKAAGPVILEIDGEPAIPFIDRLLGSAITPEEYPFFLMFGINHGEKWGPYDEENYASRLCLAIDKEHDGIVMFEPDMVEGTKFQLMFRNMDLDYMEPKIEDVFEQLGDREPLFGMYINCAGRCAGYGGIEMEDAVVLQEAVGGRVPLLGLYTGVEIAPTGGKPRGLDWTGVFCLFSKKRLEDQATPNKKAVETWESRAEREEDYEISLEAALELSERNVAKVLRLDTQNIALRHELEQKRRGFRLLAELSVSLRSAAGYENVFVPVAKRLNAALNMQKTVVLIPAGADGEYMPAVLQGYTMDEKAELAGKRILVPQEMLDSERQMLVTAADPEEYHGELRRALMLPYFVSTPILLQNKVEAILITGRMVEQMPFLLRLGNNDVETIQAIGALLGAVLAQQRLEATEARSHMMLNAMPLACVFWDENGQCTDCNEEALRLFAFDTKRSFLEHFYTLAPQVQVDGRPSEESAKEIVLKAFVSGREQFEWLHQTHNGEELPAEVMLVRIPRGEDYIVAGYIRDLRQQKAAMAEQRRASDLAEANAKARTDFLAIVSHEIRTPMNGIMAMVRAAEAIETDETTKQTIDLGVQSAKLLMGTIDSVLDYSQIETGDIQLDEKPFSPSLLVDNILRLIGDDATDKGLELRKEIAADVPEQVVGDVDRLSQAIFNVAANAVKFTETGGVTLKLRRAGAEQPERIKLVFEIVDTGNGIGEDEAERLFEAFSVVDNAYTRKRDGLGMGLAISRSIARLMKGDIEVEGIDGEGSSFKITVELQMYAEPLEDANGSAAEKELAGMKVLVAEDNKINQIIIRQLLNTAGVDAVMADNGLEALAALEKESFDLILMDIQMPEMDGYTATAQIRADERYADLPILAMTAYTSAEHRAESRRLGMNEHLTKPIDVAEMHQALLRWGKRR